MVPPLYMTGRVPTSLILASGESATLLQLVFLHLLSLLSACTVSVDGNPFLRRLSS